MTSKNYLELLSNAVPAMIFYLDSEQRYTFYNERFMDWFNVGPKDVIGKTVSEFLGEEAYKKAQSHLAIAYSGKQEEYEIIAPSRMSGSRWLSIVYTPDKNDEGKVIGVIVHATDVTRIKQTEIALRESEARFRTLANDSPMFVFIIAANPLATVSYWNKTWLEYTGQSMEEAVGRAWDAIIHKDDVPIVMEHYSNAFLKKAAYFIPAVRVQRYDGQYRWHSFKGNPRLLRNGESDGYVGVGFDVHEQVLARQEIEDLVAERTKELADTNKELQRSNQNLEEFAHVASHDLKEPIRKIQVFTAKLKGQLNEYLKEAELKSLSRIENSAERMGNLVDDLLVYSQVSERPHEMETIDLNKKVHQVLEDLELNVEEKKATVNIGTLPTVKGYQLQLQQLFQNLLTNALKYSKAEAAPIIDIRSERVREEGQEYHMITVKDNGIGFEQKYADNIFKIFSRLHNKNEYSGTGVGLSIVKKVVQNHRGFIKVKSSEKEGSTFSIFLPAE